MKFLIVQPSSLLLRIPLGPEIRFTILFSNTLSLRSSLNVRDQAPQPYTTTGNIIDLHIIIFKFLEKSREDRSVCTG